MPATPCRKSNGPGNQDNPSLRHQCPVRHRQRRTQTTSGRPDQGLRCRKLRELPAMAVQVARSPRSPCLHDWQVRVRFAAAIHSLSGPTQKGRTKGCPESQENAPAPSLPVWGGFIQPQSCALRFKIKQSDTSCYSDLLAKMQRHFAALLHSRQQTAGCSRQAPCRCCDAATASKLIESRQMICRLRIVAGRLRAEQ